MKRSSVVVLVYALIILIGGIIGYLKAGSQASLIMSLTFSIGLSLSSWLMLKGQKLGWILATVFAVSLSIFFGYRFSLSYAFMPAGLMSLLSLTTLSFLLIPFCCTSSCKRSGKG